MDLETALRPVLLSYLISLIQVGYREQENKIGRNKERERERTCDCDWPMMGAVCLIDNRLLHVDILHTCKSNWLGA